MIVKWAQEDVETLDNLLNNNLLLNDNSSANTFLNILFSDFNHHSYLDLTFQKNLLKNTV